jgi:uncharacterized protein YqhQ
MERNKIVLEIVQEIRKRHPRCGTRKLLIYMQLDLKQAKIKIGRDSLNTLLRDRFISVITR